jgi:CheY-like chemotaxis protein
MSHGGLIAQILIVLFDLLKDVQTGQKNLKEMNLIAGRFKHVATEQDMSEGFAHLQRVAECFQTADDLTTLTVGLFRLHQEFLTGLKDEGEGPVDLHAHLNPRILRAFMGRRIDVDLNLDGSAWKVPGPSVRILQVILNNIVNARDAMEWGGRLSVSTRRVWVNDEDAEVLSVPLIRGIPRTGPFMELKIKDTGPGIPPHLLSRIFEPSVSGKQSSGLGLPVALEIVQKRGGFITVRTSTGGDDHGTTFSIYLPRVEDEAIPAVRPLPEAGREVVLVVDADEGALRNTMRDLMGLGYAVLTASGVEEAVARSRDWYQDLMRPPVSAVLLDLKSAGSGAHSLVENLRSVDPYMVCLFQNGMGYLHEELHGVEMSVFVDKSAPVEELTGQMKFLIGRMRRHRPTIPVPLRPRPKEDGR